MIVLQCNDLYFEWLVLFLESYRSSGNNYPIFISIFNGTQAMKDQCLQLYDQAIVELDNDNRYQLPLDQFSLRECMTSRKVYVLADVVERFELDWVLMLDVDTLCRKNLTPWIHSLHTGKVDLALVKKHNLDDQDNCRRYSASINYFSKSAFPVIFQWFHYVQMKTSILGLNYFQFFWDQVCLYATMENYINDLNVLFLDQSLFIDESFNNEAYFWTWGTPIEGTKQTVFNFFNEFKDGQMITVDRATHYMNKFFQQGNLRESFVFANIIVMDNPQDMSAVYVLAVTYFKVLKNNQLAFKMFKALKDQGFQRDECEHYLNQINL